MIYTLILDQRMIGVVWTCVDGKCIYYQAGFLIAGLSYNIDIIYYAMSLYL